MHKSIFSRDESLALINQGHEMPTLPDRFLRIRETIADLNSNANDLAEIIATDIATSATLLKIANSTAYNPVGRPLGSLPHAIARLGTATSAQVAMSMALLQSIIIPTGLKHIRQFWTHAFAVSQISAYMASQLKKNLAEDPPTLFMAALLHDIGRIMLAIRIDTNYFDRDFFNLQDQALCEAEKSMYGIDHAEAGVIILSHWAMPEPIIRMAEKHHQNIEDISITLCSLANQFIHEHWANLHSIEDVQQQMHEPPHDDIRAIMETSSFLLPHLKQQAE